MTCRGLSPLSFLSLSVKTHICLFSDIDGSQPAASSSTINIPHKLSTPSSQTSPHPLYSVPHKQNPGNGRGAPPKFPKPIIAPPKPQSTGSDSEYTSNAII